jgi:hypothetical protein
VLANPSGFEWSRGVIAQAREDPFPFLGRDESAVPWMAVWEGKSPPSLQSTGRYFVSILIEEDIKPLPVVNKQVGLDLGLGSMVILSTGEQVGKNTSKWDPRLGNV